MLRHRGSPGLLNRKSGLMSVIWPGSLGEQRLVSVLIPRFAASFPDKAEAAVSGLIELSTPGPHWENEPALADACRLSALQGLGAVCKAAAEAGHDRAVLKGVEFLLR
jgi:hypothetical protein